jgi:hypothetical protein
MGLADVKEFNVEGLCNPFAHYMVDISAKIDAIVDNYIVKGKYITINRARQFGKTTTLSLLEKRLHDSYVVLRISFASKNSFFKSFTALSGGLRMLFTNILKAQNKNLAKIWTPVNKEYPEEYLSAKIEEMCSQSVKPVLLMIDEVDRATDFEVFIDFIGLLREMYLKRNDCGAPAFQSVILAGVHDIKNLKKKIRPDSEHATNSPWNIAADFEVDMSFSPGEIKTMLAEYESDHHTGMNMDEVAERLHYYTSGYPFLVSRLCKTIADGQLAWNAHGVDEAERILLAAKNLLFTDMAKNVLNNKSLKKLVESILFRGIDVGFDILNPDIDLGVMYGIFKEDGEKIKIANVIFETRLANMLISISETRELTERYAQDSDGLFVRKKGPDHQ